MWEFFLFISYIFHLFFNHLLLYLFKWEYYFSYCYTCTFFSLLCKLPSVRTESVSSYRLFTRLGTADVRLYRGMLCTFSFSLFLYLVILAALYIMTVSKCARSYVWIQRFSFVRNRFSQRRAQTSRSAIMHMHARINERRLFSRHGLWY